MEDWFLSSSSPHSCWTPTRVLLRRETSGLTFVKLKLNESELSGAPHKTALSSVNTVEPMLLAVMTLLLERRSLVWVKIFLRWLSGGVTEQDVKHRKWKGNWTCVGALLFEKLIFFFFFPCSNQSLIAGKWTQHYFPLQAPPTATVYIFNSWQNDEMNEYTFVDNTMKYN